MADNSTQNKDELNALSKKFSISNFLTDLPRMLNEAFGTIVKYILKFYDPDENRIRCERLDATYINATTIVAQNLRFRGKNGAVYDYTDLGSIVEQCEKLINEITSISKKQIDSLPIYPLQGWPLWADYYNSHPETTMENVNKIVLVTDGVDILQVDCDTEELIWCTSGVADEAIYLCGADMCLYKYHENEKYWENIGKYSEQ